MLCSVCHACSSRFNRVCVCVWVWRRVFRFGAPIWGTCVYVPVGCYPQGRVLHAPALSAVCDRLVKDRDTSGAYKNRMRLRKRNNPQHVFQSILAKLKQFGVWYQRDQTTSDTFAVDKLGP